MIAIVDYGLGNLQSARKGLEKAGERAVITDDAALIAEADGVVLPGVGAFKDCYDGLVASGLAEPVITAARSGRPFLGICVGLQLLFESSEEGVGSKGLGILPGRVVRFPRDMARGLKVPHMGWNRVTPVQGRPNPLLAPDATPHAYFVHSYYAAPSDPEVVLATCEHGVRFPAMVGRDNVLAVQFHPEKSQAVGIGILKAFGNLVRGGA